VTIPAREHRVQRHAPIREQVASILRTAIVELEFLPGEVLVERELCELTSASRPSVREALRQLESEGLVESRNGKGTIVSSLTQPQAQQLYELRAELEGMAAERFIERASDEQRTALRDALTRIAEAAVKDDHGVVRRANDAFYKVLIEGAGNVFLSETLGGLQRRVSHFRALTMRSPGRAAESAAELTRLVEAVEAGDAAAARRLAIDHVAAAADRAFAVAAREA